MHTGSEIVQIPNPIVHPPERRDQASEAQRHRKVGSKSSKPKGPKPAPDLSPEDRAQVGRIRQLCDETQKTGWELGDLVYSLTSRERSPLTLSKIAALVGDRHKSTLSKAKAAVESGLGQHRDRLSIFDAYDLYLASKEIHDLGMTRDQMVEAWLGRKPDPDTDKKAGQRNIRQFFVDIAKHRNKVMAHVSVGEQRDESDAQMFLGRWEDHVRPEWDGLVKLMFADPPYGQYLRAADGGYSTGRNSAMRLNAANNDARGALETTLNAILYFAKAGAEDGALILCQAGTMIDRDEVGALLKKHDLACTDAVTWVKDLVSPRSLTAPYGSGSEKLLIIRRAESFLHDHALGELGRGDLLYCPSPSQTFYPRYKAGEVGTGDVHIYQKPLALMEYLLRKHTAPGDLVLDLFGCTATMCVAAIKRGRQFRYFEADEENFVEGCRRIRLAQDGRFDEIVDLSDNLPAFAFPQSIVDVIAALKRYDAYNPPARALSTPKTLMLPAPKEDAA